MPIVHFMWNSLLLECPHFLGVCIISVLANVNCLGNTPLRTLGISGLKSRVLKLTFLSLNMMVKSGLEFILKLTEPLQRYQLTCQANSALLGRFFCTGQQQLWRGSVNFKINSRPLLTIIFKLKNLNFKTRDFSPLIEWVLAGVIHIDGRDFTASNLHQNGLRVTCCCQLPTLRNSLPNKY